MFIRLSKAVPNVFSQALRRPLRVPTPSSRLFSSSLKPISTNAGQTLPEETEDQALSDHLSTVNPQINAYMNKLYKSLAIASVLGISSTHLLALTVPVGFPSAFLLLTGFGLQHIGTDYVERMKPNHYVYKESDGNIRYGTSNPALRKLAFVSSCVGYGCIIGSMLGMIPLAPSAIPLSAISCLFSALGHINYCKFAPRATFKPAQLFLSGLFTGILGLNLITSGSTIFMWENPMHLEGLEVSSYLGLLLYNAFTAYDSRKTVEEVHNGKGDYLKHANKFSENWLYALIPHFLMVLH